LRTASATFALKAGVETAREPPDIVDPHQIGVRGAVLRSRLDLHSRMANARQITVGRRLSARSGSQQEGKS